MEFAPPFERLVRALTKLPTIGRKTAQRLVFFLLNSSDEDINELADSLIELKKKLTHCTICGSITETDPCPLCTSSKRDDSCLCVVGEAVDVFAIEKTNTFNGRYHVLGGVLSPLDGIGPDQIRIKELLQRLDEGKIEEVIIATNPTVEGETTAGYMAKLIEPKGISVSRIAYGIPVGGDLEYADEATLGKAFSGRQRITTEK
jgi:recombination protein RecR